MSAFWNDLLVSIALQHLWQSTLLLLLAAAFVRACRMSAHWLSHLWLLVLVLSVAAPLAMFAPQPKEALIPALSMPAMSSIVSAAVADAAPSGRAMLAQDARVVEQGTGSHGTFESAIILAWLLGVAVQLVRLYRGWRAASELACGARAMPWLERLVRSELPPNVRIKESGEAGGPMVVGLCRPCILVPRGLAAELGEVAMRDILNHEIAHVRRYDRWAGLFQQAVAAVFWWNPALALIGKRLDLGREMACDEHAAACTGARKQYARSLLASVERMARAHNGVFASRMFGTPQALTARVSCVLRHAAPLNTTDRAVRSLGFACVLAGFLALAYAATPRLGGEGGAGTMAASPQDIALVAAARDGNLVRVRELVGAGAGVNAAVKGDGSALIVAAGNGDRALVEALLALDADVNMPVEGDGAPLTVAAARGHLPVVERLIAAGARVDAASAYDESALISAVRNDHIDVVRRLVTLGADVNQGVWADEGRWRTPLNQARSTPMRDYLRSRGARP